MLIVVDPHSGVPVYRQLMDQIKFHIASGLLSPGDELPSTRSLSAELGVNPMTISKAYSYLEMEDIVERRPGRPLIVKQLGEEVLRDRRIEQLRENLASTVTMVRQLGLTEEEALATFRELLEEDGDTRGSTNDDTNDDTDNDTTNDTTNDTNDDTGDDTGEDL